MHRVMSSLHHFLPTPRFGGLRPRRPLCSHESRSWRQSRRSGGRLAEKENMSRETTNLGRLGGLQTFRDSLNNNSSSLPHLEVSRLRYEELVDQGLRAGEPAGRFDGGEAGCLEAAHGGTDGGGAPGHGAASGGEAAFRHPGREAGRVQRQAVPRRRKKAAPATTAPAKPTE